MTEAAIGIGVFPTKVDAKVKFEVVCAECHQPLPIKNIIHFSDCPQVQVEPCSCQSRDFMLKEAERMGVITKADRVMKEMADDVKKLDT